VLSCSALQRLRRGASDQLGIDQQSAVYWFAPLNFPSSPRKTDRQPNAARVGPAAAEEKTDRTDATADVDDDRRRQACPAT